MTKIIPPVDSRTPGLGYHACVEMKPGARERKELWMRRIVLLAPAMTAALLLISGVAWAAELIGTPGNDRLIGTDRSDLISARDGKDTVLGKGGSDELYGMPGPDSISGSEGADDVYGGDGTDELRGGDGQDDVYGGDQADVLNGGSGVDELSGGNNDETINALDNGPDLVNCGLGTDDQVIADHEDGVNGDCERVTRR
jgi:Ca2+-binding RTX toxin-like protein